MRRQALAAALLSAALLSAAVLSAALVAASAVAAAPVADHSTRSTAAARSAVLAALSVPAAKKSAAPGTDILAGTDCQVFPRDNVWHADVRGLTVAKRSAAWIRSMGTGGNLHPDFGPSFGAQQIPYGMPITIVPAGTPRVPVTFDYAGESDRIRYPLTRGTVIEGGWDADGDRHAIMVTADTCELFEIYDARYQAGRWTGGSGAHWRLASNKLRPRGWTSADAAGLPILPGILRWSEVKAGKVNHAIRVTANQTAADFIWPARHQAGSGSAAMRPPMGARFRMKASFDISSYSKRARVVLKAMKRYGLIVADNGSSWFFGGDADPGWPLALVNELKTIPVSAFEAVKTAPLKVKASSGKVKR